MAVIGGIASAEGLLEVEQESAEFGEALGHSSPRRPAWMSRSWRAALCRQARRCRPGPVGQGLGAAERGLFKAMHGKNKDLDAMLTRFAGGNWRKRSTVEDGFGH
jgi:hypothetical protein